MKKTIFLVTILAAGLLLFGSVAQVSALPFELNTPFPGKPAPAGTGSWLTIGFSTGPTVLGIESVWAQLTAHLTGGEKITEVYFNTTIPVTGFGEAIVIAGSAVNPVTMEYQASAAGTNNGFKADGDGYFDIRLSFANNNSGTNDKFDNNDSFMFLIKGDGISIDSFNSLSEWSGGEGVWKAAAHVQELAGGASTWIGHGFTPVPEPATMLLLGSGLLGLAGFGRKKIFTK